MSFEAIYNISLAEGEGKAAVAAAEQQAKSMIAEAENAGKASIEAAIARAEGEIAELRVKAAEKERVESEALAQELSTKKAVLLAKAEAKLEKAASLVVERIVNN
ncbi:MAG: hypothetical protein IKD61_05250 [Oscillospiraceae bacterium]|nr:hypothetical protein [Oscillospiraceae bacterium]